MIQFALILALLFSLPSFASAQDITTGLIGHWKFDEGSGTTAADSSGNNNTGTLTNGPIWTTGKIGEAVSFDGSNDYITMGSPTTLDNIRPHSFSLWIYPNALSGVIGGKSYGVTTSVDAGWQFAFDGSGNVGFYVSHSSPYTDLRAVSSGGPVTVNNWQHLAVSWDSTNQATGAHIYVNGSEVSYQTRQNGNSNPDDDSTVNFVLGAITTPSTSNYLSAMLDDVRIYNRALTASDIQALYAYTGGPPYCNDTIDNDSDGKIDYPFDPGCASSSDNDETDPPPPDTQAPTIPTNFSVTAVSSSQINLSWTASTDNVGVTSYRVERCQGSTCTNFVQITTPTGTTYNDTGLTANTPYRYQVRATDAANNFSGYSNIASATTQAVTPGNTALETFINNMQPGTWGILSPAPINKIAITAGNDNFPCYSDAGAWNPVARKWMFAGACIHTAPITFAIYDEVTNSWSKGPPLPSLPLSGVNYGHAYDGITVDPTTGDFFWTNDPSNWNNIRSAGYTPHLLYKFSQATQSWTILPDNPYQTSQYCCYSSVWFPETSGILNWEDNRKLWKFNPATNAWSSFPGSPELYHGTGYTITEYNPVLKQVVLLSARDRRVSILDANGVRTNRASLPAEFYTGSGAHGHLNTDPVTGKMVFLTSAGFAPPVAYLGDMVANTWTLMPNQPPNPPLGMNMVYTGASVSTHGAIIYLICSQYDSSCAAADLLIYKSAGAGTFPPPDTIPPSVPTNLTATAPPTGGSSQINLSWIASTDNVGVTGYRVERCQGSGCITFSQIATPSTNSYSDTGLFANTTYTYRVRATDAAGNLSGYSSIASATTQASGGTSPDADFQARCNGPGVVKCLGFDLSSDFTPAVYPNSGLYPSGDTTIQGFFDQSVKHSGAGALRFHIRTRTSANVSGAWTQAFGAGFGQGQTFYVQYQQRFSPTMFQNWGDTSGNTAWKQAIFHNAGATCASIELTTNHYYTSGIPIMYTDCGGRGLFTNDVPPLLQQGDYNCSYGNINPTDCFKYPSNNWVTFYYQISIGTWGQPNSTVKSWIAVDGQPYKQWVNMPNFRLDYNNGLTDTYNTVTLLPYMTGKDPTLDHPEADTWYDELIVSTQPIAAPGATPPPPAGGLLGDLNLDGTVNNFDWNIMAGVWFTNDPIADINKDTIVNTADFYFIYKNWNVTG